MSLSLRDQLLQAGLISDKQAKQASRQQGQQRREQARQPAPKPDEQKLAAQRAAEAKRQRDLELNRQQQEQAERKARKAQIRQLIEQSRLPKVDSDEFYNFVDGKRIRRLPVDGALREKLISGAVAIVRFEGRYEFVPGAVAERIRERDERAVIRPASSDSAAPAEGDDPYKDYVVPDDLMW